MKTRVPKPVIASGGEWTFHDSSALYSVPSWGGDFFSVHESGNLFVGPRGEEGPQIDFHSLVLDLERRGLRTPMLIRFSDILASRVQGIADAFEHAITEYEYPGRYRGVYPIKVNQQRHVVEEIIQSPFLKDARTRAPFHGDRRAPCSFLDNPDFIKEMVSKYDLKPSHDGAESIVNELHGPLMERAAEYKKLLEKTPSTSK